MPSLARSVPKPLKGPSLARSVPKPLKVPSLARSVPKPLKVTSLARSVPKPLKVPSLARSVPKPLKWGRTGRAPAGELFNILFSTHPTFLPSKTVNVFVSSIFPPSLPAVKF